MGIHSMAKIGLLAMLAATSALACQSTVSGGDTSNAGAGGIGGSAGNGIGGDAGGGAGGSAGNGAGGGTGGSAGNGTGGSAGGFPNCPTGNFGVPPDLGLKPFPSTPSTHQGMITQLTADSMEITTTMGVETFLWQGPALTSKFALGNEVTVSFETAGQQSLGYPAYWSIVRSSGATVAALSKTHWTMLSTAIGGSYDTPSPAGFPSLRSINKGCCQSGTGPGSSTRCDYSALETALGDMMVTIDVPNTGTIGEWSVTHLYGAYVIYGEYTFTTAITLLGPATTP